MRSSMNIKSNLNYGPQASINFTCLGVGGHSRFVRRAIKHNVCSKKCQNPPYTGTYVEKNNCYYCLRR